MTGRSFGHPLSLGSLAREAVRHAESTRTQNRENDKKWRERKEDEAMHKHADNGK